MRYSSISTFLIKYIFIIAPLIFGSLASADDTSKRPTKILKNEDFKYGTYIIDQPGNYRLGENISFNPNSPDTLNDAISSGLIPAEVASRLGLSVPVTAYQAGFPLPTQFKRGESGDFSPGGPLDSRYDPAGFSLGFFAAIVIQTSGVNLDLAGYTIEQSEEHALLQRFFAVIELAEQPFMPNQGPADFGDEILSASNTVIKNGIIGRSAHHGIHGNGNKNIRIRDVDFVDFEVAAVALNGVKGLSIKNSNATNRKDVPVIGTYSSAQFIKSYINELHQRGSQSQLRIQGRALGIDEIKNALESAINNVHHDIVVSKHMTDGRVSIDKNSHPLEYALFHNKHGIVDGNAYGFLINQIGVAVNGFPNTPDRRSASKNVWFDNVHVNDQRAFINEVVTLNRNGAVIDPVGAVFQLFNTHPDTIDPLTISSLDKNRAKYLGNPVANAQAFVAKAFANGDFSSSRLDLSRLNIDEELLRWVESAEGVENLSDIAPSQSAFFCNGDSMFHVNKGVIAFKIDGARNVVMRNVSANDILNLGGQGSDLCGDYSKDKSHPLATQLGYGGAKARAFSFAGSRNVVLEDSSALGVVARSGSVIGVDLINDSANIKIRDVVIVDGQAGLEDPMPYHIPNQAPIAAGFHVSETATKVRATDVCAELMEGFAGSTIVDDESRSALFKKICQSVN